MGGSWELYSDGSGVAILKFCLVRLSLWPSEIACNALQGKLFYCMLCGAFQSPFLPLSLCLSVCLSVFLSCVALLYLSLLKLCTRPRLASTASTHSCWDYWLLYATICQVLQLSVCPVCPACLSVCQSCQFVRLSGFVPFGVISRYAAFGQLCLDYFCQLEYAG